MENIQSKVLYRKLCELQSRYGVQALKDLAGCSRSQFYKYVHSDPGEAEVIPGHELMALMRGLAEAYDDYELFYMALPASAHIASTLDDVEANGLMDEARDGSIINGRLAQLTISRDADELSTVIGDIEELAVRLRAEREAIIQATSRTPLRRAN